MGRLEEGEAADPSSASYGAVVTARVFNLDGGVATGEGERHHGGYISSTASDVKGAAQLAAPAPFTHVPRHRRWRCCWWLGPVMTREVACMVKVTRRSPPGLTAVKVSGLVLTTVAGALP